MRGGRGLYGAGEGGTAPQPPQWHLGWAQGLQGLWLWHVPAGKGTVGEEEEEQLLVKHLQVSEVPRVSDALEWQSRRAAVPGPCALQGHGPTKRSLPGLVMRWQWRVWGGQEGAPRAVENALVHLGIFNPLVLRLGR